MSIYRENVVYLHKKNPIIQKLSDLWYDFDIWFWRHFINPISSRKNRLVYAWERATKGFDRRISWGYESMVKFYVKMLSDLIEYASGRPMGLHEICPEEFAAVVDKWNEILGTDYSSDYDFVGLTQKSREYEGLKMTDLQRDEYFDDTHNAWLDYLKRVRQYFLDSVPETCSMKNEYEDDFIFNPTWIELENGSFRMEENLSEEQEKKNKLYSDRQRVIEKFMFDSLKKGLNEIAKNPYAFCD